MKRKQQWNQSSDFLSQTSNRAERERETHRQRQRQRVSGRKIAVFACHAHCHTGEEVKLVLSEKSAKMHKSEKRETATDPLGSKAECQVRKSETNGAIGKVQKERRRAPSERKKKFTVA